MLDISCRRRTCAWVAPLFALVAGSCAPSPADSELALCRIDQRSMPLPAAMRESSGVAMSRRHPGVFWTHNDSDGGAILFAIDRGGTLLGEVALLGAENIDWEDIAVAPCGSESCIYIGDIGDNASRRREVLIYRLPEPATLNGSSALAERFTAHYPTGPRNAEALLVLPGEEVLIVTKGDSGPIELYRYPGKLREQESSVELRFVRALTPGPVPLGSQVTGADIQEEGGWIVLRSYSGLLFYPTAELLDPNHDPAPIRIELAPLAEPQGEGVAFAAGDTLILTSEGFGARSLASLSLLSCELAWSRPEL